MNKRVSAAESIKNPGVFEDENFSFSSARLQRKASNDGDKLVGIIDTLYSEHRYISSLLDSLEREANRLRPGKVPDYPLLLEIMDYLTHYPGQYHHPREDMLFTLLLARDKKFKKNLDRLLREHETLQVYNDKLFSQLTAIVRCEPADRPGLLATLQSYVRGYRADVN
jgi:hemerythrin-like domain-containing protein